MSTANDEKDFSRIYKVLDVSLREHLHLFRNKKNANPLSIFLCLVLHSNKDGWAYPSRAVLSKETGINTQHALTDALAHLRGIQIEGRFVFHHFRERSASRYGRSAYLVFPDAERLSRPPDIFSDLYLYDPALSKALLSINSLLGDYQQLEDQKTTGETNMASHLGKLSESSRSSVPSSSALAMLLGAGAKEVKNQRALEALKKHEFAVIANEEIDVSEYQEEARPYIAKVSSNWLLVVPKRRKKKGGRNLFKEWEEAAMQLHEICGDYGTSVIDLIYKDYREQADKKREQTPYTVSSPGSLLNLASAMVGKIRSGDVSIASDASDIKYVFAE